MKDIDTIAAMTPSEALAILQQIPNPWDTDYDPLFDRATGDHIAPANDDVEEEERQRSTGTGTGPSYRTGRIASDKQTGYILSLLEQRQVPDNMTADLRKRIEAKILLSKDASNAIDTLLDLPRKQQPVEEVTDTGSLDLSTLPSGRYAVPGGDTRLKIRVDNLVLDSSSNPKWNDWIFVKDAAEHGAGKRYGMQRPGQKYQGDVEDALRSIMDDPKAAAVAYGQLVGKCAICNRTLEDADSIAAGIGPICAKRF
jgi:hypothetical protein